MGAFDEVRAVAVLGLVGAMLLGTPPARAASCPGRPGRASAGRLSDAGLRAVEEGRHAEAARLFDDAYACDHHPTLLWNAARAYERAEQWALARARYATYQGLPGLAAARAAEARERLAAVDAALQRLETCGSETGHALGRLRLPPAQAPESAKLPAEAVPAAPRARSGRRIAGGTLIGVGVATAAVGFAFLARARGAYDDLDATYGGGIAANDAKRWAEYDAARSAAIDDSDGERRTMWVFFGAGAAMAIAGTVLVLTAPSPGEPRGIGHPSVIGAAPVAGGAVAFGGWRF
ncbi:MAG: hypothetical protein H6744_07145 [Deltaproteobacteria bacterium]|nr:hypothetical protein [Deltaproteobacteria bacterium]MCB9786454.1 hypothetical protein [Deltaproteobacteria bacterium]